MLLILSRSSHYCSLAVLLATLTAAEVVDADTSFEEATVSVGGATIAAISIERENVFDLSDPEEDNRLYRLVNRFHVLTRESTIRQQLLFAEGDDFDPRQIEESERILRNNKYLFEASIQPTRNPDGTVSLTVRTRDVWTLTPEFAFSRTGGENKWDLGFEESNLFGYGQRILFVHAEDVDRNANTFEYANRQLGNSWVGADLRLSDTSDGHSAYFALTRPFYALEARHAAGFALYDDDRTSTLYMLGNRAAEFRHERQRYSAFAGISEGLTDGWVTRWTAGVTYDDNRFSAPIMPSLPALIPANRKLVFPFIGVDIFEDRFEKSANFDQMGRSEDFYFGRRFAATLGWADQSFGSDRDALVYSAVASRAFGDLSSNAFFVSADVHGRFEQGDSANTIFAANLRYYRRQSEKKLFFAFISATIGHEPDLDNPIEIGGDTGLRGYPLRYQSGDSRLLISLEQRYFTDWYPFRFVRVGGAVFADIGRSWGDDPLGGEKLGWLGDVGFGLRFAPTRLGTSKVFHLDIAFPLNGDSSIDDVQILFEGKRSF